MLVLIMQIGISMIVPIGLMVALSVFIINKTGIKWISVILFVIGAAAGIRNVYKLVQKYLKAQKQPYEIAKEQQDNMKQASDEKSRDISVVEDTDEGSKEKNNDKVN
ncbi:MAG: AtpZ/AtpI family protein [Lachnospiraceae bacterium]|nr:AtpZ/AtpI family protein [Lachnospiraceae bacterium]